MPPTDASPERGIKATLLLADHAQVAEGKLNAIGAGWNITGPQPVPFALAGIFEVPWHLTNRQHTFEFDLIDVDGNAVQVETPEGEQPVKFAGQFEVGRQPGTPSGSNIPWMFALNSGPLPLAPGRQYEWRLLINGETHEDWRLAFSTRPDAQSQAA